MRVLVIGATGLIGRAVLVRLLEDGHELTAVARGIAGARRAIPGARWVSLDLARARPDAWAPHLAGIAAVVNCAGAFQHGPGDDLAGVHAGGLARLLQACREAGVRRFIHLSAVGVEQPASAFSATKREGERLVMDAPLDWVILRPSVVLGRPAFGGSALIRGLAALPWLPVMPDTGPIQTIQLDDLVETVQIFLRPDAPARIALEVTAPGRLAFADIVRLYRAWLGWGAPRPVRLPRGMAALLYRLGDFAGWLGWRPPLRSTAEAELRRGAAGDPGPWMRLAGIVPRPLEAALAAEPASVQERWFAGLYLLKPATIAVLALFWVFTALISVGPGYAEAIALMREAGAGALSGPAVIAGAIADLLIGLAIACRRSARAGLLAAVALSVFYLIAGTLLLPQLWIAPLGPLAKVVPILLLHLVALATLEER